MFVVFIFFVLHYVSATPLCQRDFILIFYNLIPIYYQLIPKSNNVLLKKKNENKNKVKIKNFD
ncbi:MAG: hypothetical protein A3K77_06775 [Euryarchaeota archaeon RBG_13_31_8]|nr:MAG: hypothetical protein A3K77_06775 [Euryarchaeota archaeon RBG_13_31_8]